MQPVPTAEMGSTTTSPLVLLSWVKDSVKPIFIKLPPRSQPVYTQSPSLPDAFFHSRLFLWMSYHMRVFRLLCMQPECHGLGRKPTACGLYKTIQRVWDFSGW
ncbi:hypothetical protein P4O66_021081 [Electrophorus voltai]|uniref:DUF6729 domain-containing protein n=1 Tax=Electrophorus voltai TaxID=2609070 RepID=A0AAD9E433_9TELE|nr:hypothetical protein P4O66_021081 [Electrophorus voltai]